MNAFKILVIAIVALALLALFGELIKGLFPQENLAQELKSLIDEAENNFGELKSTEVIIKNQEILKADKIGEQLKITANVVFQCDDLRICCSKEEFDDDKCTEAVKWNEKKIDVASGTSLKIHARCFSDRILWCTVYFGKKPSIVKIELEPMDGIVKQGEEWVLKIKTSNQGETMAHQINRRIAVNSEGEENELEEVRLGGIQLDAGDEVSEEKTISIKVKGNVTITAFAENAVDLSDKSESSIRVSVLEGEESCKAVIEESYEQEYDLELERTVEKYTCEGCLFGFKCVNAWNKEGVRGLREKSKNYAVKIIG